MNADQALAVAHSIAMRIARNADWNGEMCTWSITVPDYASPIGTYRPKTDIAGPLFYAGTSGIALFLLEAFDLTGDAELLRVARGALRYADDRVPQSAAFGFHSGVIGVAYTHARFASRLRDSEFAVRAHALLALIDGRESEDVHLDVIGGAAGSIPALLQISDLIDHPKPAAIAERMGNHLLGTAHRGPHGWSWKSMPSVARDLTGYAHGTAGMAHALAELYGATGDARFSYGAEQAVAYERGWFDPVRENWPDFRHVPLADLSMHLGSLSEEERRSAASRLSPYAPAFMSAWCHGACGIGLSRLRLYELLGKNSFAHEAIAATRTVRAELKRKGWRDSSFAVCHGTASDCEMLLSSARILDDPTLGVLALDIASEAGETFEHGHISWPSGNLGGTPDPTFMLGEAGIGYFYLRLASPTLPSAILLSCARSVNTPPDLQSTSSLRDENIDGHFGTFLRVLTRATNDSRNLRSETFEGTGDSDISAMYALITRRIAREPDDRVAAMLTDAFTLERTRYELACRLPNRCDLLIEAMKGDPPTPLVPGEFVTLGRDVRIISCEYAWSDWLAGSEMSLETVPVVESVSMVLWPGDGVQERRLSSFASFVLSHVRDAGRATVDDLVARLLDVADASFENADVMSAVRTAVVDQLGMFLRVGLVVKGGASMTPERLSEATNA